MPGCKVAPSSPSRRRGSAGAPGALAALLLVAALLGSARPAAADGAQARVHYERGRSYFQIGDYRKAMEEFKAAHVEKNDPAYIYNIAECHRQLGQANEAVVFYRRFLALSARNHQLRPDAERRIRELEAMPPPRVAEPVTPAPAAVPAPAAAPAPVPPAPVAAPLSPRPVSPAAPAPTVTPAGEPVATAVATSAPSSVVPPAAPPPPSAAPESPPPATLAPAATPPVDSTVSRPNRMPAYVVGATSLVALGIGIAFAADARSQWGDSQPHCPGDVCDAEGDRLSRGAQRAARIADVAVAAGLVGGGAALWLLVRARRASESAAPPAAASSAVRLSPQFGSAGPTGLTLAATW